MIASSLFPSDDHPFIFTCDFDSCSSLGFIFWLIANKGSPRLDTSKIRQTKVNAEKNIGIL